MNLAELAIKNPLIVCIIIIISLIGGWLAYDNMPRFQDPEYLIRVAKVTTTYPGASPEEVMEEVTEPIETALLQIPAVKLVESVSTAGLSDITVEVRYENSSNRSDLQLVWTKIRNEMVDTQAAMPPGAGEIVVNDEYGDVFGIYYMLTGPDYTNAELYTYARELREDLLLINGVSKVVIAGTQEEVIYVEVSSERAASLGLSLYDFYNALSARNTVEAAGELTMGEQRVAIVPSGEVDTLEDIRSLVVTSPVTGAAVRFGDIAVITRGYREPARQYIRFNGEPALGIGVANMAGVNIVKVGEAIGSHLTELAKDRPAGMSLQEYYHQGKIVNVAITNFARSVVAALLIVFVTLLIFMGFRSGIVMGTTVLVTMAATLLIMWILGIPLHRISLGALIISLGMLVDNGVVVTDDILVNLRLGRSKLDVAKDAVSKNMRPLLAGTIVGALAFAPIGLASGNTAEYTGSIFWVVTISLGLSWVFAFTITPLLCYWLFPTLKRQEVATPIGNGRFMDFYRDLIKNAVKYKFVTVLLTIGIFGASVWGFRFVPAGFFPTSTSDQIVIDFFLPEGTKIEETLSDMTSLETHVRGLDHVEHVQTLIGGGTFRFRHGYETDSNYSSFGQLLIRTTDYRENDNLIEIIEAHIASAFPNVQARGWKFQLGPGGGSKIEASFSGPNPVVLRHLAQQARDIMTADGRATLIRDDWRARVPIIQPRYSEVKGGRAGISRQDMVRALNETFVGRQRGFYREGELLIPIISRPPLAERQNASDINGIHITTPTSKRPVPLAQVIDGIDVGFRDSRLIRSNRLLTIKAQSDPVPGILADVLFAAIRPDIESIELPEGYTFKWKGEFSESSDAQGSLVAVLPLAFTGMVLTVILLFNAIRQPIIIWSVVPLAIVGVVIGLVATGLPLEFMGILGVLSLSGLIIQNSLVLVYKTDEFIREDVPRFDAVIDAAVSRLRPVTMGAFTTVFGILPLYFDPFFQSMTVVLAAGLSFATLITLFVTPALYVIFFRIKPIG